MYDNVRTCVPKFKYVFNETCLAALCNKDPMKHVSLPFVTKIR